ncbi:MAG: NAD(P)/FAD-dependent oxidoreductase [Sarcina sp.]
MKYVVIGASASGINGAKKLRELNPNAQIILISKDDFVYSRCILHHYIRDERTVEKLNFSDSDFMEKYKIQWLKGLEVLNINSSEKTILLNNDEVITYDKLLICSGASSFIPPIENLRSANYVYGLRNLDDAIEIKKMAKKVKSVAVLGAGLIGIDAISGLMDYDLNLTLVEMGDRILPLQLDKEAASVYEEKFREKGVNLKLSVKAEKILIDSNNNPIGILLNTGETIPCEMIVVATGVRSNTKFLENSGIEFDKFGVIIDENGKTNINDVYAAGDVTGKNPIWPIAVKEGIIAAYNMSGVFKKMTDFFGSKNTMNFMGLATLSVGKINLTEEELSECQVELEKTNKGYKKIVLKNNKIYGALIQGDLGYVGILTELIRDDIDISLVKKNVFDIDYSDFFKLKENLEYTYKELE